MSAYLMPVNEGKPIAVDKAVVFIGRHPDCDVLITHSRKISRKHCCIAQVNGSYLVRDLGSMNGLQVNGKKVTREARLQEGDELMIGDCRYVLKEAKADKNSSRGSGDKARDKQTAPPREDAPVRRGKDSVAPIPLASSQDRFLVEPPMPSTPDMFQLPPAKSHDDEANEIVDFDDDDESIPLQERKKFKDSGSQVELIPE